MSQSTENVHRAFEREPIVSGQDYIDSLRGRGIEGVEGKDPAPAAGGFFERVFTPEDP